MKITLFTSNQARHVGLMHALRSIASELYVVIESSTIFPGAGKGIHRQSPIMERYMNRVREAERAVFGLPGFLPEDAKALVLQFGDLRNLPLENLGPAKDAELFVVFGCGFIKGPLFDFLESKRAVNIHMGVSPQFRGSSCNFWATRDGHADKVGATIHLLGRELDSGEMLFHALPKPEAVDSFLLGMKAVQAAQNGLVEWIRNGKIFSEKPVVQDRSKEIRYSVGADFTDDEAQKALDAPILAGEIFSVLQRRDLSQFVRPWVPA
jgi:hypothetical protein